MFEHSDLVVLTDFYDEDQLVSINNFCREKNKGFICGGSCGLYGYTFVDFGNKFIVTDKDGEENR